MSTADLYTADYPHGTPDGYTAGCRGSACPNRGDAELQTCKDAHARYLRDRDYKRLADSGAPTTALAAREGQAPLAAAPKQPTPQISDMLGKHGPKPTPVPNPALAVTPVNEDPPAVAHIPAGLPLDHPDFPHGTTRGAQRGCKVPSSCPGHPDTGITCTEARSQYNREYAASRKKPMDIPGTESDIPAPEPVKDDTPEPAEDIREPETDIPVVDTVEAITAPSPAEAFLAEQLAAAEAEIIELHHHAAIALERNKELSDQLSETRDLLAEADRARHHHDYPDLGRAFEELRNQVTIDTQLDKLTTALAVDVEAAGGGIDVVRTQGVTITIHVGSK